MIFCSLTMILQLKLLQLHSPSQDPHQEYTPAPIKEENICRVPLSYAIQWNRHSKRVHRWTVLFSLVLCGQFYGVLEIKTWQTGNHDSLLLSLSASAACPFMALRFAQSDWGLLGALCVLGFLIDLNDRCNVTRILSVQLGLWTFSYGCIGTGNRAPSRPQSGCGLA